MVIEERGRCHHAGNDSEACNFLKKKLKNMSDFLRGRVLDSYFPNLTGSHLLMECAGLYDRLVKYRVTVNSS
jgi:hypothetical protein